MTDLNSNQIIKGKEDLVRALTNRNIINPHICAFPTEELAIEAYRQFQLSSQQENFPTQDAQTTLVNLAGLLEKVPSLFNGDITPTHSENIISFPQLSGDTLNSVLTRTLNDAAFILHPDSLSIHGIFSPKPAMAEEGVFDLLEMLSNCYLRNHFDPYLSPRITKPAIIILNLTSKDPISVNTFPNEYVGTHWVSLIILPKNFSGLINSSEVMKNEQVILMDSLKSDLRIPASLKTGLQLGKTITKTIDGFQRQLSIPPLLSAHCEFHEFTSVQLQTSDNSCGLWSLFNVIHTMITGSSEFHFQFLPTKSNDLSKNAAAFYLWQLFGITDNQTFPFNIQSSENTSNNQNNRSDLDNHSIALTKKGTPDKRFKNNRVYYSPPNEFRNKAFSHNPSPPTDLEPPTNKLKRRRSPDLSSIDRLMGESCASSPATKHLKSNSSTDLVFPTQKPVIVTLNKHLSTSNPDTKFLSPPSVAELLNQIKHLQQSLEAKEAELGSVKAENEYLRNSTSSSQILDLQQQLATTKQGNETLERQLYEANVFKDFCIELEEEDHNKQQRIVALLKENTDLKQQISNMNERSYSQEPVGVPISHKIVENLQAMEEESSASKNEQTTPISGRFLTPRTPRTHVSSQRSSRQHTPRNSKPRKTIIIPWQGRILAPTLYQLLVCEGDLNKVERFLGSRPPNDYEKRYTSIRIPWNDNILWATPEHLLEAKGDMNLLEAILPPILKEKRQFRDSRPVTPRDE